MKLYLDYLRNTRIENITYISFESIAYNQKKYKILIK